MMNDSRLVEIVFHSSLIAVNFSTDKSRSYYLKTSVQIDLWYEGPKRRDGYLRSSA